MVLSMQRWRGKVAIVTGASSGIGAALAKRLVEEGLKVVGLARRSKLVAELAHNLSGKPGELHPLKVDLTKETEILNAFKWVETNLEPAHILVNNAGVFKKGPLTSIPVADLRATLELNVLAVAVATQEAVKSMIKHQIAGHIINMNSIAGHRVANAPNRNLYPASKFAVTALTETLRQELTRLGTKIKVTSVSPGLVETEMTTLDTTISEEMRKMFVDRPHLKTEDIVDGVIYVLSTPPHVQVHELTIKPINEPH